MDYSNIWSFKEATIRIVKITISFKPNLHAGVLPNGHSTTCYKLVWTLVLSKQVFASNRGEATSQGLS